MARQVYNLSDLPPQLFPERPLYEVDGTQVIFVSAYIDEFLMDEDGNYVLDHAGEKIVTGKRAQTEYTEKIITALEICDTCGTVFDPQWKKTERNGLCLCRLCLDRETS